MSESLDPSLRDLNDCGCSAGTTAQTPVPADNRDGLDHIAYRVGTHGQFRESMLAALSEAKHAALRGLGTRADDDFTIALLDGWATVADVLTFYQERLINESYLRTATERRSVLELARTVGYELDPGVAAATWLAFLVDQLPGAAASVQLPAGVKVQSIPGQDEKAQLFETGEKLEARVAWNELRARIRQRWVPSRGDTEGWLQGTATGLRPGDMLLFMWTDDSTKPIYWLWDVHPVIAIAPDHKAQCTRVTWRNPLQWHEGGEEWPPAGGQRDSILAGLQNIDRQVFALRKKAAIFGSTAANWRGQPDSVKQDYLGHPPDDWEKREWPGYEIYATDRLNPDLPARLLLIQPTPEDIAIAAKGAARGEANSAKAELPQAVTGVVKAGGAALKQGASEAADLVAETYPLGTNSLTFPTPPMQDLFKEVLLLLKQFGIDFPNLSSLTDLSQAFGGMGVDLDWSNFPPGINFHGPNIGAVGGFVQSLMGVLSNVGFTFPTDVNIGLAAGKIGDDLNKLVTNLPPFLPFNAIRNFVNTVQKGGDPLHKKLQTDIQESVAGAIGTGVAIALTRAISDAMVKSMKVALAPPSPLPPPTIESVASIARITAKVGKYATILAALPAENTTVTVNGVVTITGVNLQQNFLRTLGMALQSKAVFSHGAQTDPFEAIATVMDEIINGNLLTLLKNAVLSTALEDEFDFSSVSLLPPGTSDQDQSENLIALSIVLSSAALGLVAMAVTATTDIAIGLVLVTGAGVLATAATGMGVILAAGTGSVVLAGLAVAMTAFAVGTVTDVFVGGALSVTIALALRMVGSLLAMAGALVGLMTAAAGVGMLASVAALIAGAIGVAQFAEYLGPKLLLAAKRSELAVIAAVNLALQPRKLDAPLRLLPSRDRTSIDLDAIYQHIAPGSWLMLGLPDEKRLFRVARAAETARAEFQHSMRVTEVKLEGSGLSGPYAINSDVIDRLVGEGLPPEAAEALRHRSTVPFRELSAFLAHIADTALFDALNNVIYSKREIARMVAPHLRDLLILSNRSKFHRAVRDTNVFAESELLPTADEPVSKKVQGMAVVLDSLIAGEDLPAGRELIVTGKIAAGGKNAGQQMSEAVIMDQLGRADPAHSRLQLHTPGLVNSYEPESVLIRANVASATHGETVMETLGDGDASVAYQRFALKQVPLTFTRADNDTGKGSTLEIWVNDVKWTEVPSLFDRKPNERIFITRLADDGTVTVLFGDGRSGARLPTGAGNIRAVYRKGTGLAGNVRAGQLKTLLTRPLGLRDVVSPLAAMGADDPEAMADARRNAPLTVLTMGRVVSLQDYEDYSRAYPGIAKALATWTWSGRLRGVMVTVAMTTAPGGDPTDGRIVIPKLLKALRELGNPYVPLQVQAFRPAEFEIAGKLEVSFDHDLDKVLAAAQKVLGDQYSFAAREFGQPVILSEVIAILQAVDGVVSLDIDHLQRTDVPDPVDPAPRLLAKFPALGAEAGVLPAELLTIVPASLNALLAVRAVP